MKKNVLQERKTIRADPDDEEREALLIGRFVADPAGAYAELLERYTPELIRMIRRHTRDSDDVMEVYTSICERLRANDFQALRRFREGSAVLPWLAVVAANASRDQFRKKRASSAPKSVLDKLDAREQLVFRYYFQDRMTLEEIAELVSGKHRVSCTVEDVRTAIDKINDLLSVKKRWHLLAAISANRTHLSVDELVEAGYEVPAHDDSEAEDAERIQEQANRLAEALKTLDPEDRLMVQLRFEQEMSAIEIAGLMRLENHKYVYTRLRTLMSRLRRIMGVDEP